MLVNHLYFDISRGISFVDYATIFLLTNIKLFREKPPLRAMNFIAILCTNLILIVQMKCIDSIKSPTWGIFFNIFCIFVLKIGLFTILNIKEYEIT